MVSRTSVSRLLSILSQASLTLTLTRLCSSPVTGRMEPIPGQVMRNRGLSKLNTIVTRLPLFELQTLGVVGVIGEAISVKANQTPSPIIWLFINNPASILNREAAWFVLKVIQLEIRTLVEDVDSISI